jgi:anaerobic selenocysteine-containing dehydrogenase
MDLRSQRDPRVTPLPRPHGEFASTPPPEKWDGWTEYEGRAWPKKVAHEYLLVPTICFNCESGCGLLAYVDKETLEIRKLEGNPVHPASRGRLCAKGPATLNQINDPERVLYPMRRVGERGAGRWERVLWDSVLDEIAGRWRADRTFEPRLSAEQRDELYAGWRRAVERAKGWAVP